MCIYDNTVHLQVNMVFCESIIFVWYNITILHKILINIVKVTFPRALILWETSLKTLSEYTSPLVIIHRDCEGEWKKGRDGQKGEGEMLGEIGICERGEM